MKIKAAIVCKTKNDLIVRPVYAADQTIRLLVRRPGESSLFSEIDVDVGLKDEHARTFLVLHKHPYTDEETIFEIYKNPREALNELPKLGSISHRWTSIYVDNLNVKSDGNNEKNTSVRKKICDIAYRALDEARRVSEDKAHRESLRMLTKRSKSPNSKTGETVTADVVDDYLKTTTCCESTSESCLRLKDIENMIKMLKKESRNQYKMKNPFIEHYDKMISIERERTDHHNRKIIEANNQLRKLKEKSKTNC